MTRQSQTGASYHPSASRFDGIEIPAELESLIEGLAEFNHDTWARSRLDSGWKYGAKRDDNLKHHPCLVPYDELSAEDQDIDRDTVRAVVRAIVGSGFRIVKP